MIPKLIHQIWRGPLPPPLELMTPWESEHVSRGWTYKLWREDSKEWEFQKLIDLIEEIPGKVDIMRYELLLQYGGIYIDADTEFVQPLDERFLEPRCWAGYESELVRPGLLANGQLGSLPHEQIWVDMFTMLTKRQITGRPAWQSVGPDFLTEVATLHPELHIFPARTFNPHHFDPTPTGTPAPGSDRDALIFGRHRWGSHGGVYVGGLPNPNDGFQYNRPIPGHDSRKFLGIGLTQPKAKRP
jgi:mannosyltransferase OCH1-like enzyme